MPRSGTSEAGNEANRRSFRRVTVTRQADTTANLQQVVPYWRIESDGVPRFYVGYKGDPGVPTTSMEAVPTGYVPQATVAPPTPLPAASATGAPLDATVDASAISPSSSSGLSSSGRSTTSSATRSAALPLYLLAAAACMLLLPHKSARAVLIIAVFFALASGASSGAHKRQSPACLSAKVRVSVPYTVRQVCDGWPEANANFDVDTDCWCNAWGSWYNSATVKDCSRSIPIPPDSSVRAPKAGCFFPIKLIGFSDLTISRQCAVYQTNTTSFSPVLCGTGCGYFFGAGTYGQLNPVNPSGEGYDRLVLKWGKCVVRMHTHTTHTPHIHAFVRVRTHCIWAVVCMHAQHTQRV